jgi:hypothetical protein
MACTGTTSSFLNSILSCDIPVVLGIKDGISGGVKNTTNKKVEYFINKTTCFGPCTGSSSGLKTCLEGDYAV